MNRFNMKTLSTKVNNPVSTAKWKGERVEILSWPDVGASYGACARIKRNTGEILWVPAMELYDN